MPHLTRSVFWSFCRRNHLSLLFVHHLVIDLSNLAEMLSGFKHIVSLVIIPTHTYSAVVSTLAMYTLDEISPLYFSYSSCFGRILQYPFQSAFITITEYNTSQTRTGMISSMSIKTNQDNSRVGRMDNCAAMMQSGVSATVPSWCMDKSSVALKSTALGGTVNQGAVAFRRPDHRVHHVNTVLAPVAPYSLEPICRLRTQRQDVRPLVNAEAGQVAIVQMGQCARSPPA